MIKSDDPTDSVKILDVVAYTLLQLHAHEAPCSKAATRVAAADTAKLCV